MHRVSLNDLKDCLKEDGFTILGHGTGGNNIDAIYSIFKDGLRASHTSIFYTTIGLDIDENLIHLKYKLDHWEHLDSENIILIKLPNDFFNIIGNSTDLDCEKTRAFVKEKKDENGHVNYFLEPKFIIGAYNRNLSQVLLNPKYEWILTEKTIQEMTKKLEDVTIKTKIKNEILSESFNSLSNLSIDSTVSKALPAFDMNSSLEDLVWNDEEAILENEDKEKSLK